LEGTIVQLIEGKEYLYPPGTCCLINRSLQHLEHYQARTKVLYIGMSPEFIMELFNSAKCSSFKSERDIYQSTLYNFIELDLKSSGEKAYVDFIPTYQNHQNAVQLHSMADDMINTLLFPQFGAAYKMRGLLCSFLAYLSSSKYYHCSIIKLDTSSDFLIFSRISSLFEESNGRMSRGDLEQQLNYSGDYLNRIVNKYSGMCLFDYGMNFCLKKAAQYLTETTESISTIAVKLQFSNRTHFYNLFREKYGVTPKEYRQMHQ
jgi:AraC-like DNA-binding protein